MKAQVELTGLEARALETAKLVTNYQQSAKRLGDHAIEQARLLQNLKGAEERYVLYTNKREEARIGDALDQGGVLNVTIAERPRAPALPVRSAWNFGLWGIVLGGTFSTGLAFTADRLDPAFRTPDEVVAYLGTRVLASLPEGNA